MPNREKFMLSVKLLKIYILLNSDALLNYDGIDFKCSLIMTIIFIKSQYIKRNA
jgi:hypothetical protein